MHILRSNRNYRLLWMGQVVSVAGDWLRDMGMLFWVFDITGGSFFYRSIVVVAELLPPTVMALVAGSLADRFDRRKLLVWANIALALCSLGHVAAVWSRQVSLSISVLLVASCFSQVQAITRAAVVRASVTREESASAVAITSSTFYLYQVLGPLLGMGLYYAVGPTLSFSLDTLSFLIAAGLSAQILLPVREATTSAAPASAWADFKSGLSYTWNHRVLRAMLGIAFCSWVGRGIRFTLLIFLVTNGLRLPKEAVTTVQSLQGLFMLAVSLSMAAFAKRLKRQDILGNLGFAMFGIGLLGMALAPHLPLMLAAAGVSAAGMSLSGTGSATVVMRTIDEAYAGRFFGLQQNISSLGMLLASAAAGPLASWMGVRPIFSLGAVAVLLSALLGFAVITPALNRLYAAQQAAASHTA